MALTPKQELFALEYLKDLNATQAALRAGYSPRSAYSQAHDLLKKPDVANFIAQHHAPRVKKLVVDADRVITELGRLATVDMRKVARWGHRDAIEEVYDKKAKKTVQKKVKRAYVEMVDSDELDDDTAAAISSIEFGPHGPKLKFYDKRAALVDLGRHLGVFKEQPDITIPVTFIVERTRRGKDAA